MANYYDRANHFSNKKAQAVTSPSILFFPTKIRISTQKSKSKMQNQNCNRYTKIRICVNGLTFDYVPHCCAIALAIP